MGHVRLGRLARTRAWKEVVRLIACGADASVVADATWRAAEKALQTAEHDVGFQEAVYLLTQMAVAASKKDPVAHLAAIGVDLPPNAGLVDVTLALTDAMDRGVAKSGKTSDLGEVTHRALVDAVSRHLGSRIDGLLAPSADDVRNAVHDLRKTGEFAALSRAFFSRLTLECTDYFLSRNLATHVGAGQRFATMNGKVAFDQAMKDHFYGASLIVEKFSGDWLAKRVYHGTGDVTRSDAISSFGVTGLKKMRAELSERTKQ